MRMRSSLRRKENELSGNGQLFLFGKADFVCYYKVPVRLLSEKNPDYGCVFDKHRAFCLPIIITQKIQITKSEKGVMMMEAAVLQDYERRRLLEYADSFRELADSFQNFGLESAAEEALLLKRTELPEDGNPQLAEEKMIPTEEERQLILWERQLSEQRGIFAGQLQEMSRMLSEIAKQERNAEKISEKKYRQLAREMKAEGILVGDLFYIRAADGHRQYSIQMRTVKTISVSSEDVAGLLSVLLDTRIVPHRNCGYFLSGEWEYYMFQEEPCFHVLTGTAKAIKQTESVSGDCFESFEYGDGKVAILLSDGMGAGESALKCSAAVVDLMQHFLEAGFSVEAGMRLINGVLLTGGVGHYTSTMDCCNIDLYQGTCHFYKVGAAPSYLKRENLVEQISSRNLPLGLVDNPESESVTRFLEDGHYIILLSDGVAEAMNQGIGEAALPEVISRFQTKNPSELAGDILTYVLHQCKGEVRDDMTVLVTGFWETTR